MRPINKQEYICKECGKKFLAWKSVKRQFCSNECRYIVLHRETAIKRKDGVWKKCPICKEKYYVPRWKEKCNRGKYCSTKCYWKNKKQTASGKGNTQYIDGRTKKYPKAFYHSAEWRTKRKEIYKRDNYECQLCGKHGGGLHAHHIISAGVCKDPLSNKNIITLCQSCHTKVHGKLKWEYQIILKKMLNKRKF